MRILQILFLIGVVIFLLIGIPAIVGLISFNTPNVGYVAIGVIILINLFFVAKYLLRGKR